MSLDSGEFFSTTISSFSVAIVCALTLTNLTLLFFHLVYNKEVEEKDARTEVVELHWESDKSMGQISLTF
jgi:hypothetical protein